MLHIDIPKLKGKIVEKGMTTEGLAEKLQIDRATLYRRISTDNLRIKDVQRICEALSLTSQEAIAIFLAE